VTIHPINEVTSLKKGIWKYVKGSVFFRRGSNSMSTLGKFVLKNTNKSVVEAIEKSAMNNIEFTLDGVFDFMNRHHDEYHPVYKVFNEQFVLCWAGNKKQVGEKTFYSRVDIELINEQVRLFYSTLDEVKIEYDKYSFRITEYVYLGIKEDFDYYPLEKTIIHFKENGKYDIATEFLFQAPLFNKADLHHILNNCNALIKKIHHNIPLTHTELLEIQEIPINYLICILNKIPNSLQKFKEAKDALRNLDNKTAFIKYKEAARVLRKVNYY
jgi:hypothetical protein